MMSYEPSASSAAMSVVRPTRARRAIIGLLFVTVVINYLDRSSISIAGPRIAHDLGLSPLRMGLVFSAFAWAYAPLQLPGGLLVDRVRPRILYSLSIILWSITAALHSLTGSLGQFLGLRALLGTCEVPAFPINNRIITTWLPEHERASAVGFYTSGQYVGLAFLTPVLVLLQQSFGWRGMFLIAGLIGLAWGVAFFALYAEPRQSRRANAAELDLIRKGGGQIDWVGRTAGAEANAVPIGRAFRNRKLWGLFIGQACVTATSWFFLTWFPTYLVHYRHIDFIKVGFMATVPFLAAYCGVLLSGFLSDYLVRRGFSLGIARKVPIVTGLLLATSIIGANYVSSPPLIIAFLALAFFGNGMAAITWSLVSTIAPINLIGIVGGVFNFCGTSSGIVVPLVIGALISGTNFAPALLFVGALGLVGACSFLFLVGRVERIT
jgi:MFS transporter, ACS family, D-galactonate transporter